MKDNKKKTIVVIALAAVILCVGVFQFVIGGSAPAAPPRGAVAKKEDKKTQPAVVADPPKNPLLAANLPARDPFQAGILPTDPKANPQPVAAQPKPQPQPRVQPLPQAQIGGSGNFGNAPLTVQLDPEAKFGFTVSGVMLGAKPMAVFTDSKGDQRLVMLGGSLDPDSKVISIDKDAVTIKFHGKTIRLTVEGNPNAK